MAEKKYLSLEGLQEYDALLKEKIAENSETSVLSAKEYTDSIASGKADISHSHTITDVSGLQVALDEKDAAIEEAMTAASNQDAVVLSEAQMYAKIYTDTVAAEKADKTHSHAIADVSGLQEALSQKTQVQIITWGVDD